MVTEEQLGVFLLSEARDFNETLEYKIDVDKGVGAELYGGSGVLDSINLVAFIIAIEQAMCDQFGLEVTLADERAMSQQRSPFSTIGMLAKHILSCIVSERQS